MNFLFVALGGALGAVARYAICLIPVKTGLPILTFITNVIGAVLIGFVVGGHEQQKRCLTRHGAVLEDRGVRRIYNIFNVFA